MGRIMDGEMGFGNYLRDHVRQKVNAYLEESTPPLDRDHTEQRKEQLKGIKMSNQEVIQRFAVENGLVHWHTHEGLLVGEKSMGCPLCMGFKIL